MWYFSYGTDLSDDLLEEWAQAAGCRPPQLVDRVPAVLANHRLCFSVYDDRWGGGVADIVPQVGKAVSGVLVNLGPHSAEALDRLAGRAVDRWGRERGVRRASRSRSSSFAGPSVARPWPPTPSCCNGRPTGGCPRRTGTSVALPVQRPGSGCRSSG